MEVAVVTDTVLCIHANKNITSSVSHVENSKKVTVISKAIRNSLDLFLFHNSAEALLSFKSFLKLSSFSFFRSFTFFQKVI